MDYLLQLIRATLTQPGQAELAFALLAGIAATLAVTALGMIVVAATDPMRKRLRQVSGDADLAAQSGRTEAALARIGRTLHLGKAGKQQSRLQEQLFHAGYDSSTAALAFHGIRFTLAIGLPVLVFMAASVYPRFSVAQVAYAALFAAVLGFLLPGLALDSQERRRQRELINGFPDALDLLVACTEAGMGLNAALQRVAEQMIYSYPALSHQFNLVNYEIRGGVDRITALRNLHERTGLDSIRGLVGILSQTLRYGTSVADTLRIFAEDLRDKRMQAAEEQAAKIGTKMIFPLVFCLFPAFFLVAIGPAIIGVIRAFE